MLASALNFVAPTLVVGGLELGLWNFAASSTQALSLPALAWTCDKRKSIEALMYICDKELLVCIDKSQSSSPLAQLIADQ